MDYQKLLQDAGLHAKEASIYLILLETGAQKANYIARKSKVERANVYYHLESLREKGLVTLYTENDNTTYFKAEDPSSITRYLNREKEAVSEKITDLEGVLPQLAELQSGYRVREPKLRFYQSTEAVRELYEEIIACGAFKAIVNIDQVDAEFPDLGMQLPELVQKKRLQVQEILVGTKKAEQYQASISAPTHEVKLLSKAYDHKTDILIFGEQVAFISYGDQPVAFVIEDERITKAQHSVFAALWGSLE